MGRPQSRTARVDEDTLALLAFAFEKPKVAFSRLRLAGAVSFDVFLRAWRGESAHPHVVQAIYRGWDVFADQIVGHQLKRLGVTQ